MIVWNGSSIVLWDRRPTRESAGELADELWTQLVARGWMPREDEARHTLPDSNFYRRQCEECGEARAAGITHRRHHFVVLRCDACQASWNARERSEVQDRRQTPRPAADRRQAA